MDLQSQDDHFHLSRVLTLAGVLAVLFIARMLISPLLIAIEAAYGFSHSQGGALFLVMSIGYSASTIGSGFVARVLRHRGTVALAVGLTGAALTLLGTGPPVAVFYVLVTLIGVGAGLYMPSGVSMLTGAATQSHWGKGLAVHELGAIAGFFLAPLIAEAALRYASWQAPFLVLGIVCLLYSLLIWRFARGGEEPGAPPSPKNILAIWRIGAFWVIALFFVLVVGLEIGVYSMLPKFLIQERGIAGSTTNTLVSVSRLTAIVLVFSSGWLSDRFGARRLIGAVSITAGLATIGIGLLTGFPLVVVVVLQPMLVAAFFPAGFAELARVTPPESRNVAVSLLTPVASLFGTGVAPALMGRLADIGYFWLGFVLLGGVMLLSMVFLPLLPGRPVAGKPA